MAIPKPKHLKRYQQIAWLLVKHGRSDLAHAAGLDEVAADSPVGREMAAEAESLCDDLEALGPTFVKLGQLLSTRPDLLPPAYLKALARLHDKVVSFGFADVEKIVTSELGVRLSKAFAEFESTPLAAASLGQVHRARLRDGRRVAVKVQRPGVRERVLEDLEAFKEVAELVDQHAEEGSQPLAETVEEFRKALLAELDYMQEARNLVVIGENLAEFERIVVPRPIEDYTRPRVLTMDYAPGRKVP